MTRRKARKMATRMMTRKIQVDVIAVILAVATALFVGGWLSGLAMSVGDQSPSRVECSEEDHMEFVRGEDGVGHIYCNE